MASLRPLPDEECCWFGRCPGCGSFDCTDSICFDLGFAREQAAKLVPCGGCYPCLAGVPGSCCCPEEAP